MAGGQFQPAPRRGHPCPWAVVSGAHRRVMPAGTAEYVAACGSDGALVTAMGRSAFYVRRAVASTILAVNAVTPAAVLLLWESRHPGHTTPFRFGVIVTLNLASAVLLGGGVGYSFLAIGARIRSRRAMRPWT